MVLCPHCGKNLPPQMRFCPHCGKSVDLDFEQIKGKLAADKKREEDVERERRTRKLFVAGLFILIVALSLLLAVPRVARVVDYAVYSPPALEPPTEAAHWLLETPGASVVVGRDMLAVPRD